MIKFKPKFKIGDIVSFDNDFSFNPADKVKTIGKIIAIHVHQGKGLFAEQNVEGKILYKISGYSTYVHEEDLEIYND